MNEHSYTNIVIYPKKPVKVFLDLDKYWDVGLDSIEIICKEKKFIFTIDEIYKFLNLLSKDK